MGTVRTRVRGSTLLLAEGFRPLSLAVGMFARSSRGTDLRCWVMQILKGPVASSLDLILLLYLSAGT